MKYTITIDIPTEDLEVAHEYFTKKYGYIAEETKIEVTELETIDDDGNTVKNTIQKEVKTPNTITLLEHVSGRISQEITDSIYRKKKEKAARDAIKSFEETNNKAEINFNISE